MHATTAPGRPPATDPASNPNLPPHAGLGFSRSLRQTYRPAPDRTPAWLRRLIAWL